MKGTIITLESACKIIAKQKGLRIDQVRDSIIGYSDFVLNTIMLDTCPEDLIIKFPFGNISFKKKKGLKAGSTYKHPVAFGKCEKGEKVKIETVVVEEDRPDYLRLWFDFIPSIQEALREKSEKRYVKKYGK